MSGVGDVDDFIDEYHKRLKRVQASFEARRSSAVAEYNRDAKPHYQAFLEATKQFERRLARKLKTARAERDRAADIIMERFDRRLRSSDNDEDGKIKYDGPLTWDDVDEGRPEAHE